MNLEATSVLISPGVLAQRVGEEMVLLSLDSSEYFGLNMVGAEIWEQMAKGSSLLQICCIIERDFEAPRERVEQDILALLGELRARGLISLAAISTNVAEDLAQAPETLAPH